jgi:hypothetical protein
VIFWNDVPVMGFQTRRLEANQRSPTSPSGLLPARISADESLSISPSVIDLDGGLVRGRSEVAEEH